MKSFPIAKTAIGLVGALALPFSAAADAPPTVRKPNILVILTDDQGRGDYSAFGTKGIRTPSIDRIAREGMTFNNFYASALPPRVSLHSRRKPR